MYPKKIEGQPIPFDSSEPYTGGVLRMAALDSVG